MQKPSIPKGTRDFSPEEMAKRNYIFDTIKEVYRLYGFRQIETPAMENLSTLMGKYGEEGDKLLFKLLESGDYLNNIPINSRGLDNNQINRLINLDDNTYFWPLVRLTQILGRCKDIKIIEEEFNQTYIDNEDMLNLSKFIFYKANNKRKSIEELRDYHKHLSALKMKQEVENIDTTTTQYLALIVKDLKTNINKSITQNRTRFFNNKNINKLTNKISEKGLRYDLTVPFARYVVMHRNEITFPFKRFQIQPVWRADRPQKGRYREFFQCDADVVGSDSLLNEVELIQIIDEVFRRLNIRVSVKLNNRKILSGIAEIIGEADKITDITVAIDKLDKIGLEKVNEELLSKNIPQGAIDKLQPIILLSGTNNEKIATLKNVLSASEIGLKGLAELEFILNKTDILNIGCELELDLTLARGLNYYTGAIIEVKALDVEIGSITGGGRYDNLTGIFGLPGVSGVGISFGADRIYDVLNQLNLFPENSAHATDVLFVNFGDKEESYILPLLSQLRSKGICAEIYPEAAKMKKQMSYADSNNIPFVALVGENEMKEGKITLKDMKSGEQELVDIEEIVEKFKV